MASISWPGLEAAAVYLFAIAVAWRVPSGTASSALPTMGLLAAGLGGLTIAGAYWREHTRERQQSRLHAVGTGLIAAGTVGIACAALM